jgi:FtsZ-binding cell division protein ZapB
MKNLLLFVFKKKLKFLLFFRILFVFLRSIWKEMIENVNNLLDVFEGSIYELMKLCDDRKKRIESLEFVIKNREEKIRQANQTIKSLQSKYDYLLTARRLETDEEEYQNARKRVNKLVREVETCIALLNE